MSFTVFLLLTAAVLAHASGSAGSDESGHDKYPDFAALAQHERAGIDYRIELEDRGSTAAVFAIHGGLIEHGTTEIARKIAGSDRSFYSFEGIKKAHNWDLHVTSAHFDEPRALALASHSRNCVSMHGFVGNTGSPLACVGGGNVPLAQATARALQALGGDLRVQYPCQQFAGAEPANIVNRCANPGVQIEMTGELRDKLENDSAFADRFAVAVRGALTAP